ncbi:hypothetical protein ACS0TY_017363 [Phlomoides rotata]
MHYYSIKVPPKSEADASVATPYIAAVLEYRVTFYEQTDGLITENSFANGHANGNTVYDAQHPCRSNVAVRKELHTILFHIRDTKYPVVIVTQLLNGSPRSGSSLPPPFTPCTLKTALTRYADLLSAPKNEEYAQYVLASQRSLLEVMSDFPSSKPPLGVFFTAIAPRPQPRFYSISSSPKQVFIFLNVVPLEESNNCSWAPIFGRNSNFNLPIDPKVPIIMIGLGTGLAPLRSFLQERLAIKESGAELSPSILFFECRNRRMVIRALGKVELFFGLFMVSLIQHPRCVICCDGYKNRAKLTTLPCAHCYGHSCGYVQVIVTHPRRSPTWRQVADDPATSAPRPYRPSGGDSQPFSPFIVNLFLSNHKAAKGRDEKISHPCSPIARR